MKCKFEHEFGSVTLAFSEMEAEIRILLSGLAFSGDSIRAAAFLDSSQLVQSLRTIRKLARNLVGYEQDLIDVIRIPESLREKRNLFIHGIWNVASFEESDGFAIVRDLNTKFEKLDDTKRRWTRGDPACYKYEDFEEIRSQIGEFLQSSRALRKRMESEDQELEFPDSLWSCTSVGGAITHNGNTHS